MATTRWPVALRLPAAPRDGARRGRGERYWAKRPSAAPCRNGSKVPPYQTSAFGFSRSARICAIRLAGRLARDRDGDARLARERLRGELAGVGIVAAVDGDRARGRRGRGGEERQHRRERPRRGARHCPALRRHRPPRARRRGERVHLGRAELRGELVEHAVDELVPVGAAVGLGELDRLVDDDAAGDLAAGASSSQAPMTRIARSIGESSVGAAVEVAARTARTSASYSAVTARPQHVEIGLRRPSRSPPLRRSARGSRRARCPTAAAGRAPAARTRARAAAG